MTNNHQQQEPISSICTDTTMDKNNSPALSYNSTSSLSPASITHVLDFSAPSTSTSKRFTLESPTVSDESLPTAGLVSGTINKPTAIVSKASRTATTRSNIYNQNDIGYYSNNDTTETQRLLSNDYIDVMETRYQSLVDQERLYQREHCRRAKHYRKMRIAYLLKLQGTNPLSVDLESYLHHDPWCFNDDDENDSSCSMEDVVLQEDSSPHNNDGTTAICKIPCPLHENSDLDPISDLNQINDRIMQEYQYNNEHFRQRAAHYRTIYQSHLDIIF